MMICTQNKWVKLYNFCTSMFEKITLKLENQLNTIRNGLWIPPRFQNCKVWIVAFYYRGLVSWNQQNFYKIHQFQQVITFILCLIHYLSTNHYSLSKGQFDLVKNLYLWAFVHSTTNSFVCITAGTTCWYSSFQRSF